MGASWTAPEQKSTDRPPPVTTARPLAPSPPPRIPPPTRPPARFLQTSHFHHTHASEVRDSRGSGEVGRGRGLRGLLIERTHWGSMWLSGASPEAAAVLRTEGSHARRAGRAQRGLAAWTFLHTRRWDDRQAVNVLLLHTETWTQQHQPCSVVNEFLTQVCSMRWITSPVRVANISLFLSAVLLSWCSKRGFLNLTTATFWGNTEYLNIWGLKQLKCAVNCWIVP